MARSDTEARRLHPKLRVLANGSDAVNACRSQISSTVVSVVPRAAADSVADLEVDLAAAQDSTQSFDMDLSRLVASGLAPRQKLTSNTRASNSYVNVFIELQRGQMAGANSTISAADRLQDECTKALKGLGKNVVRGAVKRKRNFITATIPVSYLETLKKDPDIAFIHPAEPLKLDLPEATVAGRPTSRIVGNRRLHNTGDGVLIGIIDVNGFDFAHSDFLDENGDTRFIAIWDQGGDFRASPNNFDYGSEFGHGHLNAALAASRQPGGLPATLLEPQSQRSENSHGTHVASIAAGNKGVCSKAQIAAVLVDVPQPTTERERRRFTFSDSSRISHAVEYLLDLAKQRGMPISINISLGTNGGAHDGASGVSRWLDALLATPGRAICVAAGNAGQEAAVDEDDFGWIMGRIHTSERIASRGLTEDLEWVVVGNGIADVSENELEIWYSAQDRFTVMLQPPGETDWIEVGPQEFVENQRLGNGTTISIYNELYHPTNGDNYIAIYLSPNLQPGQIRGIEAGLWRVRIRGDDIRDGRFHGWIERDDPHEIGRIENRRLFRFPSFFSTLSNVDSHSISSLACSHRVIAVANLNSETEQVNISSSQGPTRDDRFKPDIVAPGTDIVAAKGFSTDNSKWVSMTGTSMASPYVAGVVGLMLAANGNLTSAQCMKILHRTAQPLPGDTYDWRNDAGFGAIDPEAAVTEAASFNARVDVS